MKYLYLAILFIAASIFTNAQGLKKGNFSANIDYDATIYGVIYTSKYKGTTIQEDTTGTGTQMLRLNAQYSIFNRFSAGVDLRSGKYLENPENAEANGNSVSLWGLNLRFYPVNREKFNWYIGTTFGGSNLEINRRYTFIVTWTERYKFTSSHFALESGFNWYFAKNFGMNFGLGYCSQNYLMKEKYVNSDKQDLTDWDNRLKAGGMSISFGLAMRFGKR